MTDAPPDEVLVLLCAKEFGILPSDVEERMSGFWWEFWKYFMTEKNRKPVEMPHG